MTGSTAGGALDTVLGAAEVRVVAAEHAVSADRRRRLDAAVVERIVAAGFPRHFVPARWGGTQGGFADFVSAVSVVGEGCASTAWCSAIFAATGRIAAFLPRDGQAELWGNGPDQVIVAAISPSGRVRAVDGGWRISGTWGFTSGIDHSDWSFVAAMVPAGNGQDRTLHYFLVPRRAYQVLETWDNVGMRATGSNSIVLDDVFVPHRMAVLGRDLWDGQGKDSPEPLYQIPFRAINGLTFAAPALGAARGALEGWTDYVAAKRDTTGRASRDRTSMQLALARSAAEIDAAEMFLERTAHIADEGRVDEYTVVRGNRDCALAAELLSAAADRLFRTSGARGQVETGRVPRAWRDVNCMAGHVALQFEPNGAAFAAWRLARTLESEPDYLDVGEGSGPAPDTGERDAVSART